MRRHRRTGAGGREVVDEQVWCRSWIVLQYTVHGGSRGKRVQSRRWLVCSWCVARVCVTMSRAACGRRQSSLVQCCGSGAQAPASLQVKAPLGSRMPTACTDLWQRSSLSIFTRRLCLLHSPTFAYVDQGVNCGALIHSVRASRLLRKSVWTSA